MEEIVRQVVYLFCCLVINFFPQFLADLCVIAFYLIFLVAMNFPAVSVALSSFLATFTNVFATHYNL